MGFRISLKSSNDEIVLEKENVTNIRFLSDTQDDNNARSTDINVGIEVEGKIIAPLGGENSEDGTRKLLLWSLVSAEESDAYRSLVLEVILAGNVVRKYNMPNIFVVDYVESYDDKVGHGKFNLKLKQKKEKIKDITVDGGYQYSQN